MMNTNLTQIFSESRPLIGMIHLLPLPGAPRWEGSMDAVLERALDDARSIVQGGMDGIIVENFLDAPFYPGSVPAETVAALSVVVREVVLSVAVPVGVNVLRNDAMAGLAIAAATGARFVRVNVHTGVMLGDQGWLHGEAHETVRLRKRLGVEAAILADVMVKHATPPPGLELAQAARDASERGLADGLIVSGAGAGPPRGRRGGGGARRAGPAPAERVRTVKEAVPDAPVWIGSGLSAENVAELLPLADGAIVGSALMLEGRAGQPVEIERVQRLVEAARSVR